MYPYLCLYSSIRNFVNPDVWDVNCSNITHFNSVVYSSAVETELEKLVGE